MAGATRATMTFHLLWLMQNVGWLNFWLNFDSVQWTSFTNTLSWDRMANGENLQK